MANSRMKSAIVRDDWDRFWEKVIAAKGEKYVTTREEYTSFGLIGLSNYQKAGSDSWVTAEIYFFDNDALGTDSQKVYRISIQSPHIILSLDSDNLEDIWDLLDRYAVGWRKTAAPH